MREIFPFLGQADEGAAFVAPAAACVGGQEVEALAVFQEQGVQAVVRGGAGEGVVAPFHRHGARLGGADAQVARQAQPPRGEEQAREVADASVAVERGEVGFYEQVVARLHHAFRRFLPVAVDAYFFHCLVENRQGGDSFLLGYLPRGGGRRGVARHLPDASSVPVLVDDEVAYPASQAVEERIFFKFYHKIDI